MFKEKGHNQKSVIKYELTVGYRQNSGSKHGFIQGLIPFRGTVICTVFCA